MAKKAVVEISPSSNEFTRYPYLDSEGRLTERALFQLNKPFDPMDLKWLPTDVKREGNDETALALVYTDPRTYHERLDLVFGPGNWGSSISFTTASYFKAIPKKMGYGANKDTVLSEARDVTGFKIFAIVNLQIAGLGTKSSTGEEDTSDGNAATSAEAQAFKRACSQIGIGRYFYSFPRERMPYGYGKFKEFPKLPPFAIPQAECAQEGLPLPESFTFVNNKGVDETWSKAKVIETSQKYFGKIYSGPVLIEKIQELRVEKERKAAQTKPAAVVPAAETPVEEKAA
jgi:hypothetical protein